MKTVAYASPFVPPEWLAAHSVRPVWMQPSETGGGPQTALGRGVCPFAAAVVNAVLAGGDASAVVLATTCDQMRYAAALLERDARGSVFLMNVPSTWQTAVAGDLYLDELKRLGRFLEQLGGQRPAKADLARVMSAYDRSRSDLLTVRPRLSGRKFAEAVAQLRGDATLNCDLGRSESVTYSLRVAGSLCGSTNVIDTARRITLAEWDQRYAQLRSAGLQEPDYGGPLGRHVERGDRRLLHLRMDNSAAALRLWNFLLTEQQRLHRAAAEGKSLVGVMKDLGTVSVMAYSLPDVVAFYPDAAWWIPCIMQRTAGLLEVADSLGIDDSFCPVRAMLGAFETKAHFPIPALLICSVGATCDDLSAIAQRLESRGHPILWWEIPHRRLPEPEETAVQLPGGFSAPQGQVALVGSELRRIRGALEDYAGERLTDEQLAAGVRQANRVRRLLAELRNLAYGAAACPLPALEMLIAEMLAIHFCSDRQETIRVLEDLLAEARGRVDAGVGVLAADAVRVFWVNPVADLRAMNLLEDTGGRVCGTEYLFSHALDPIPEDLPPIEALARMALADPMVGSAVDRARRICADARRFRAEAVVISRIPGASHCALEAAILGQFVQAELHVPVVEVEVPPIADAIEPTLRTRLEGVVEAAREKRETC